MRDAVASTASVDAKTPMLPPADGRPSDDALEAVQSSPFVPPGYRLTWHDEFDGQALDASKWRLRPTSGGVDAMTGPDNVQVREGALHLRTLATPSPTGAPIISTASVGTQSTFQQAFGYFEARIRPHRLQGTHCSFWLQSPTYGKYFDDPKSSGAEIDIYEFFGAGRAGVAVDSNVYWNPYADKATVRRVSVSFDRSQVQSLLGLPPTAEISDSFHTFGLLWTPAGYRFFIDGRQTLDSSGQTVEGASLFGPNLVSSVPEYIIFSVIAASWEVDRLPVGELPDEMIIDYVRVYRDGCCPP